MAGRFELLDLPLSSAPRLVLVRILRSVVQSLVLAMLNAGHDVPLRRAVAGERISDHDTWRWHLLLQQLAQHPLGSWRVASALGQDIEHDTGLVHRPPRSEDRRAPWLTRDDPLHQARSGSDQHTRHHYKLDRSGGQRRIGSSLIHATPTGRDPIDAIL